MNQELVIGGVVKRSHVEGDVTVIDEVEVLSVSARPSADRLAELMAKTTLNDVEIAEMTRLRSERPPVDPQPTLMPRPDGWACVHGYRNCCSRPPVDPLREALVPLDVLDAWQETAKAIELDIVGHFDVDHTKAETRDAMIAICIRLSSLAQAAWLIGHSNIDGRWQPPTRYMRHMAEGAPPPPASEVLAALASPATPRPEGLDRLERFSHRIETDGKVDAVQLRKAIQTLRDEAATPRPEGLTSEEYHRALRAEDERHRATLDDLWARLSDTGEHAEPAAPCNPGCYHHLNCPHYGERPTPDLSSAAGQPLNPDQVMRQAGVAGTLPPPPPPRDKG